MASAGGIRMGGVFVEIGADPSAFFSAVKRVNRAIGGLGKSLVTGGGRLTSFGLGMATPLVAATRSGAKFESVLLGIRASTGATAADLDRVKAASMQMSQALGVGPTEAAQGMLELLKAGMSLDSVLGGAGQSAIEFAKVGEMDVAKAAVVMSDAMNVFGVSGVKAANTLSAAADASSTTISQMSEAFSMSSAVAGLANQSIDDLSAALAILANAGVKGSDAGTSVKTMLMRLMAPADDGAAALAQLGLTVDSFRSADKKMLPMAEILAVLNSKMQDLDQTAKDDIFRRIFGADAIRAASILSSAGVDGFERMRAAMAEAMPVGEKFRILMSGLAGAGSRLLAGIERLAIAISGAVAPAFKTIALFIEGLINGFAKLAEENKGAVMLFAKVSAAAIGIGGAMLGVGYALQAVSGSVGLVLKGFGLFSALASPVLLVAAGIGAAAFALYKFKDQIGAALGSVSPLVQQAATAIREAFGSAVSDAQIVFSDLASIATTTFDGVYEAIVAGDLAGAMDILWAGLVAGWLRGVEALMSYVDPWTAAFQDVFSDIGASIVIAWDRLYTDSAAILNTMGAWISGFFGSIANDVMATFDTLVASIQKSWIRVQGLITGATDTEDRIKAIDNENALRAEQRRQSRPGIKRSTDKAAEENAREENKRKERADAVSSSAKEEKDARQVENRRRADQRRADTQAAEENVTSTMKGRRKKRVMDDQYMVLLKDIESATSLDQLHDLYGQFQALNDNGRLTAGQADILENAIVDAQERLSKVGSSIGGSPAEKAATGGAEFAGMQSATSMGSIAGTFSSVELGGLGYGSTLAQQQLEVLKGIKANTDDIGNEGAVAA